MAKTPTYYFPLGSLPGIFASLWLSFFFGCLANLKLLYDLLLYRASFFTVKDRTGAHRPAVLDQYGTHTFIRLKRQKIRLHYVSSGKVNDGQLMLLVHGFPECWFTWREQMDEFKDQYHTVAVNMRGYGDSDKPKGVHNYAFKILVDDMIELIECLVTKTHPKCLLVAHDWGGLVCWTVAQTRPDLVDRFIVLNAPHIDAWQYRIATSWKQFFSSFYIFYFNIPFLPEFALRGADMAFYESLIKQYNKKGRTPNDQFEAAYKHYFGQPDGFTGPLNYYRAILRGFGNGSDFPLVKVQPKTLIIWGKADFALAPELASDSAALCEQVTIRYVEKAAHFVQWEDPETVNGLMKQFLAK